MKRHSTSSTNLWRLALHCCFLLLSPSALCFAPQVGGATRLLAERNSALYSSRKDFLTQGTAAALLLLVTGTPAFADEYGVEKEAPTLYTGETLEICTKRGPLGACLQTEVRTVQNDNDKAAKYFRGVTTQKQQLAEEEAALSGNTLIEKLRQQTADNKEKNDLEVARRTFENDQSATFGPFDRQVLIMNTDGKTFTLLQNPQAMRLKKQGFIQGRKFITQPSDEEIERALTPEEGGFLSGIFGGGSE